MNPSEIAREIRESIKVSGHFEFTWGLHSLVYIDKRRLSEELLSQAAQLLANLADESVRVVVAPAEGAIPLGTKVAECLAINLNLQIDFVVARKDGDEFTIDLKDRRKILGRSILVVEDILTTGVSARKTVVLVRSHGGIVMGVSALWNRGEVTHTMLEVPWLHCVVQDYIPSSQPGVETCPACREDTPLDTNLGHAGS